MKIQGKAVLFIGPEYRNPKGGIGAVINKYELITEDFKFIPSYNGQFGALRNNLLFIQSLILLVFKLLTNKNIEIIHLHGASKGSFYRKYLLFYVSKIIFKKKVVYHIHGGGFHKFYLGSKQKTQNLIAALIEKADALICLSKSWFDFYNSHFKPKKILILPNSIEPFNGEKHAINERKIIFLFLGRIMKAKGVYDLLDVFEMLIKEGSDNFECWFGGNGEDHLLAEMVKEKGLDQHIKVLGWISGEIKQSMLSNADVYVLPSYNEGMPVSILEAMSAQMPVISTNVGGIPEMIDVGETGFLTEPGDKVKLKEHIVYFLNNPGRINEMGIQAKKITQERYSQEKMLLLLNELYSELLS